MKKILMIATGGTIACVKTENGLTPKMDPAMVLDYVPEIYKICEVELLQLFSIDSSNMVYTHWLKIASAIEENYNAYDGFVILHGTDTMAYTAAALSYLIQNIKKPVVLTGAQQPIDKSFSDGKLNLLNSFCYAISPDAHGVVILFNGKVIAGTRARKVRSKSFNAFSSIDFPEIALVRDRHIIRYISRKKPAGDPLFFHAMNPRVFPLRLIPGMKPDLLHLLEKDYDALVIESFGVGGIPEYPGEDNCPGGFAAGIAAWIHAGKTIVITTQVPHEGSDMAIYRVGLHIKEKYNVLESYDMTFEATITKLMWALSVTDNKEELRKLFYKPINFDIISEP